MQGKKAWGGTHQPDNGGYVWLGMEGWEVALYELLLYKEIVILLR